MSLLKIVLRNDKMTQDSENAKTTSNCGKDTNKRVRPLDWRLLFDQLECENTRSILNDVLLGIYDLSLELIAKKKKNQDLILQLNSKTSCKCEELQKTVKNNNNFLEALGSTIVKLDETRNVEEYLKEAYSLLSSFDSVLLTPSSEGDNTKSKSTIDSQKSMMSVPLNQTARIENASRDGNPNVQMQIGNSIVQKSLESIDKCDASVMDESASEVRGTLTGRASPIIGVARRGRKGQDVRSPQTCKSPKAKLKLSQRRKGGGFTGCKQTRLSFSKLPRTVNLSNLDGFGGGVRGYNGKQPGNPHLESVRTSADDDDVIQPSPTSDSVTRAFYSKLDLEPIRRPTDTSLPACQASPPGYQAFPPSASSPVHRTPPVRVLEQDDTTLLGGIDFDEPMETEILDVSMDLLERHRDVIKHEPLSPLCENRSSVKTERSPVKTGRSPVKSERSPVKSEHAPVKSEHVEVDYDTNMSVSVLRRPFCRGRAERENVAPRKAAVVKAGPEQPTYLYKEETVRRKAEKLVLPGWSCDQCEHFYAHETDPARLKKLMDACSKHRGRQNPARHSTPPGFWRVGLTVPEDTEELNRLNNVS